MPARHLSSASSASRRRTAVVALLIVALAVGVLVGLLSATAAEGPATPAASLGPQPGFAATLQGAEAAAAWYVEQIYDARGHSPDQVRTRFAPLVTRTEALERLVQLTATDAAGQPVTPGSVTRAAAIGVKQEQYQPSSARIGVWSILVSATPVVGAPSTSTSPTARSGSPSGTPQSSPPAEGNLVEPRQRWELDVVSLEWRDGAWRFAATTTVQGPVPPLDPRQAPNAVGAATYLLDATAGGYEAVPDGR